MVNVLDANPFSHIYFTKFFLTFCRLFPLSVVHLDAEFLVFIQEITFRDLILIFSLAIGDLCLKGLFSLLILYSNVCIHLILFMLEFFFFSLLLEVFCLGFLEFVVVV